MSQTQLHSQCLAEIWKSIQLSLEPSWGHKQLPLLGVEGGGALSFPLALCSGNYIPPQGWEAFHCSVPRQGTLRFLSPSFEWGQSFYRDRPGYPASHASVDSFLSACQGDRDQPGPGRPGHCLPRTPSRQSSDITGGWPLVGIWA